jgi:SAM-dependent methyltransferase
VEFDPDAYKRTTRQQWDEAAEAWHRWGPALESWLGDATAAMLDDARVGPGAHVLDVAAGAGGQTLAAARRAGDRGRVVATDLAPAILAHAAEAAAEAGLGNVETLVADAEALDVLEPGSFDAVICRLGLMFFPDQRAALQGMRRALRPGGRVAVAVYATADRNPFFSLPLSIIRERARLPAPAPGQPGPFGLGAPGVLEQALRGASFTDVGVRAVPSPLRFASAAECTRFQRESFAVLRQMLGGLHEADRAGAWADVEAALRRFEGPDGFRGPCELLVGRGAA